MEALETANKGVPGFAKTKIMNWLIAGLWAFIGAALLINKMAEQPVNVLLGIAGLYLVFVGVPAFTALALSGVGKKVLQKVMLLSNGAFILLAVLGLLAGIYLRRPLASSILAILIFVIPSTINLLMLRSAINSQFNPSKNGIDV